MRIFGVFFIICAFTGSSLAATWKVSQDGLGDFETIRDAVNAAGPGDQILVGPGIYFEQDLVLDHDLNIASLAGPESTFLDGQDKSRCLHVTTGATIQISGFTIQNGLAYDGAGIHVDQGSNATVTECTLKDNNATYTGGAGFVREPGSVLTFESCDFWDNFAPLNAGAVGVSVHSTCNFFDCEFSRNDSNDMAGAIANFGNSMMNIQRCVFFDNSGGECGAIRIYESPAVIFNNTFFANTSGLGTIYLNTNDSVIFSNNIIAMETNGFGVLSTNPVASTCNIYFANQNGPTSGFSPSGSDGISDPLFCSEEDNFFGLCEDSPALPENNDCGLIGGVTSTCPPCGPVVVEDRSWGTLKALFR
jgi:hypothetical protein